MLYPLKFTPVLLEKIWGGTRLKKWYSPASAEFGNVGEAWVLSAYEGRMSPVADGHLEGDTLQDLLEVYMNELVGDKVYERYGNTFPLLVKFIDADADLSVQVHPDDEYALEHDNSLGKTELWYVTGEGTEEATLIAGWKEDMTADAVRKKLADTSIMQAIQQYNVHEGDYILLNSGLVHALRKGTVVAEIQENSDVTYRLYDYDRTDSEGNKRPLHVDKALDVLNYEAGTAKLKHATGAVVENLARTPFFTVNLLNLSQTVQRDYAPLDSFVAFLCVEGKAEVETTELPEEADSKVNLSAGELCLVPAILNDVTITPAPHAKLLEIYIEL